MRFSTLVALALLAGAGCQSRGITQIPTGGSATGSPPNSSGAGTSSGASSSSASSSGGATSSAAGASSTGGGTTSGTTGGTTGTTGSPYWDGGYVYCSLTFTVDAGMNGDGGRARWLCTPGTYFCDLGGDLGNCFQCRSDADCTNQALPTYDPDRPRCDLDSGVAGYENRCQVCLTSVDCKGNPAGPFCNLQASTTAYTLEPPIENFGFETCGPLLEDCRVDAGPVCRDLGELCNPTNGRCEAQTGECTSDQDCAGSAWLEFPYLVTPVCVDGYCAACDGGACRGGQCSSDADCGAPAPICVNGSCSCQTDAQCGDAGLACIPSIPGFGNAAFCGLPCTAPDAPSCNFLEGYRAGDICNLDSGLCEPCTSNQQCENQPGAGGPICLGSSSEASGDCGCLADSDCAPGQACQPTGYHDSCVPRPADCSIQSCEGDWCDWDSGECANSFAGGAGQLCDDDYDCSHGYLGADYCDPKSGTCVYCRDDADCEHQDGGFGLGVNCLVDDAGAARCGCISDQGCVGIAAGSRCVTDLAQGIFGRCACLTTADCPPGEGCAAYRCGPSSQDCFADSDCGPNLFCAPDKTCRPRCDQGHSCEAPESICDVGDTAHENASGAVWCFACLDGSDCPEGLGCDLFVTHTCMSCSSPTAQCPANQYCTNGVCRGTCDAGFCPTGQVCDTQNVAGSGYSTCFQCLTPADCPGDEGCNSWTHTCGSCVFPFAGYTKNLSDCPPDDICSDYWSGLGVVDGVCLPNCDRLSCPADKPICAILPALTPNHRYCFGCLSDADCADAGPGAWCDVSVGMTFSCQPTL